MNLNPRRVDTISALMDTVEMTEWRGEKIPGVRLVPGQECLFVQIRLALRAAYPRYSAIAIHYPRNWGDNEMGWQYYESAVSPSRFGNRKGCGSMDRVTTGLGDK
jgi:hypothetical protein